VYFGRHIRDRISGERTLAIDSALGSVLQAATVVVAAWLVALPLATASVPGLASGVRNSTVLRAVDEVMPAPARQLPADLRQVLDSSGFPDVLSPFAPTPITQVGPPDPALANLAVVQDVQKSVLKIRGKAPSCSRPAGGHRFRRRPGAGDDERARRRGDGRDQRGGRQQPRPHAGAVGGRHLLRPVERPGRALRPRPAGADDGVRGRARGDRRRRDRDRLSAGRPVHPDRGEGPRPHPAARFPNIYDSGEVTREVYTVRAVVRSGNSGGPMIRPDGKVIGVVFGAALDDSETGFVLTAAQVKPTLDKAPTLTRPVDTGSCAA
jgi:hypothetical protein